MVSALEKIYRAGLKFLVPLELEETYDIIIKEALKLADAQYASISLTQNGKLERVYASSNELFRIKPQPLGFTYKTYKSQKPNLITTSEVDKIHPQTRYLGIKSILFIPLSYRNKSSGVLSIYRTTNQDFTKEQLNSLELFGSYVSLAIRKTQLHTEVENTLRDRDLFIGMAAHELRTPLTSVGGYIQLLVNRFASKNTVEANWIKQLYFESLRLNRLVKELLEINQVRSGKLPFVWEESNLIEIIDRALNAFRFSSPLRKVIISNLLNTKDARVIADFDKIIQVITNIFENSVKYSPDDTEIKMILEEKQKWFIVTIVDYGPGIPKKDLKLIGREFYKGKNSQEEGMGLGLYLANYIVKHHKGKLVIKSKLNKGTKVMIYLPKLISSINSKNPLNQAYSVREIGQLNP